MIILRQTDSPSGPGGSIVQSCRGFFIDDDYLISSCQLEGKPSSEGLAEGCSAKQT